jgi:hypothetical protein
VKEIGMCSREARRLAISIVIVICAHIACDRGIGPSPLGYAGEWMGTTSQGTPIRFSVSAADTVTSFTLAYNFSADCSGTLTYTQLALAIHTLNPPGPPPYDQPGFGYSTSSDDGASGTLIAGHFSPDRRSATGQFSLVYYGACGTVVGRWNATRR